MARLIGRGVSPGVTVGRAVIALRDAREVRYRLAASGVERERQRLRAARKQTRGELEEISARVSRTVGDAMASIFAAQLLMLDDPLLWRRADELIRVERINAEWAIDRTVAELQQGLAREGDDWMLDRIGDVTDVGGRLLRNLGRGQDRLAALVSDLEPPLVLVTDDLAPSMAAQIDWSRVRGLVTAVGGPTNHTTILMRSLDVPAVAGLAGVTSLVSPGQTMAIDGATGEVVIEPADALVDEWRERARRATRGILELDDLRDRPARTSDGVRIHLYANLEIVDEVGRVRESGAEGIGLYRSEFLLDPQRADAANEEAQVEVYRELLSALAPMPVTIRTFDGGPDVWPVATQRRTRFGARGVRGLLQPDERFRGQIRALLRASDAGQLRILLPFVTRTEELKRARQIIEEIRAAVGVPPVPVGAMIEVPSAALTVDLLADDAEFLSVGTNDLIQYTLAVDRSDETMPGLYEPTSPAVLRLLSRIVVGARRAGREVYVCGEMAADPRLVALLVGLGFRGLSATPAALPSVKHALAAIDSREVRTLARRALRARAVDELNDVLTALAGR